MPLQSNPFQASKQVVTDVPTSAAQAPVVTEPQVQIQQLPVQIQPEPTPQPRPQPPANPAPTFVEVQVTDPKLTALEDALKTFGSQTPANERWVNLIYSFRDQLLNKSANPA